MALEIQIGERGIVAYRLFRAFSEETEALPVELIATCLGALGEV